MKVVLVSSLLGVASATTPTAAPTFAIPNHVDSVVMNTYSKKDCLAADLTLSTMVKSDTCNLNPVATATVGAPTYSKYGTEECKVGELPKGNCVQRLDFSDATCATAAGAGGTAYTKNKCTAEGAGWVKYAPYGAGANSVVAGIYTDRLCKTTVTNGCVV